MTQIRPRLPSWFEPYVHHLKDSGTIREFVNRIASNSAKVETQSAKVLVFDIETAPLAGFVWSMWKQNVAPNQLISDWFMLTWSAKWLFGDKVFADKLTPDEVQAQDDSRISKGIWDLLDEADIVIAHNGDKFDLRCLNTRFLLHGLNNPSPYQSIDTLKHARKHLKVSSNRLDYLGQFLGVGRKLSTGGMDLWVRCMKGESEALQEMETYNIQDVRLLEEVYLKLRPFIKPHPNMYLFIGDNVERCPTCGSEDIKFAGEYRTYANAYDAFRCGQCGSMGRSRKTLTALKDHYNMKVSLPK